MPADNGRRAMGETHDAAPLSVSTGDNRIAVATATPPGAVARDFLQKLEHALIEIVTLKVVTVIGQVNVTGAGTHASVAILPGATPEAASTEIDLFSGDITNTFST